MEKIIYKYTISDRFNEVIDIQVRSKSKIRDIQLQRQDIVVWVESNLEEKDKEFIKLIGIFTGRAFEFKPNDEQVDND